jgi:hypothetical protein
MVLELATAAAAAVDTHGSGVAKAADSAVAALDPSCRRRYICCTRTMTADGRSLQAGQRSIEQPHTRPRVTKCRQD